MENYIKRGSLNIHNVLDRFLRDEMLSGLDITSDEFWKKFEGLLEEFHQRNKDLLAKRSLLQDQISTWHKNNDFNINSIAIGASIACSGICLTLKKVLNKTLYFDVSDETREKTNFSTWKVGSLINLERSLKVGDELGGHFVYGHVDTTALISSIEKINGSYKITFNINVDYGPSANSNFQLFDIDITKLSDTTDVKVILTFDCDTATIRHELYGIVRDGIPDHFNIKEEVIVNFHKDKRTVIIVEASPVCNPEISVFYE